MENYTQRRDFIALLGGVLSWPFLVHAQQKAMPVIGFLQTGGSSGASPNWAAFLQGLSETGCVEGRNVAIEHRIAENKFDRLPAFAAELLADCPSNRGKCGEDDQVGSLNYPTRPPS